MRDCDLHNFTQQYPRLFVLSGAGVSTDSGIPGYRDAEGRWNRAPPVLLRDFVSDRRSCADALRSLIERLGINTACGQDRASGSAR